LADRRPASLFNQVERPHIKLQRFSLTVAAALAIGLASCSKNEPVTSNTKDADKAAISAAKTAEAARVEAEKAAAAAKTEAAKVAEAAKLEAARVADVAKAEAAAAADAAKVEAAKAAEAAKAEAAKVANSARIQGLIDNAKSLVAEGKYTEAASALQQLAGQVLTADQTTLVESMKQQIQKALAAQAAEKAAGSVGNLLKK
jgi:hypothetical protein